MVSMHVGYYILPRYRSFLLQMQYSSLKPDINLEIAQYLRVYFQYLEQCCSTIEISSTDNSGYSAMGTYTRQESTIDGRALYANGDSSRFLYWVPSYDGWAVSNPIELT